MIMSILKGRALANNLDSQRLEISTKAKANENANNYKNNHYKNRSIEKTKGPMEEKNLKNL